MPYQTRRNGQYDIGFYKKLNSVGKPDITDRLREAQKVTIPKNRRRYPMRELEFFISQLNFR